VCWSTATTCWRYSRQPAPRSRARAGDGPTLLELKTYRTGGHFQGDPCKYRTREEEALWQSRDPLPQFRAVALQRGAFEAAELAALEATLAAEITEAIDFSLASPDPEPASALDHVYAL
jgi:pyruvate dehydrogenase E1 component alpha subunit